MKAVKLLLIAGGLLIGALLIAGLIAPKEVEVKRSIQIKAPPAAVFPHIKYIDKMAAWHPWLKKDPNLLTSVVGKDGTVGAVRRWDSDHAEVGEGEETILKIEEGAYMESRVHIMSPRESEGINQLSLVDYGGNTQVIWQFKYQVPYPWNAFMLFNDGESGLGDHFSNGLQGLKNILERMERTSVNYMANDYSLETTIYAIIRKQINSSEVDQFAQESLDKLTKMRSDAGLSKAGFPAGFYYGWDMTTDIVDYAFGIPVIEKGVFEGVDYQQVSGTNQAKTIFINDLYSNRKNAHQFLQRHLTSTGLGVVFPGLEIYMKGALSEFPDEQGATRLVYRYEEK